MQFKPWPKITRLENKRAPIFTEKIDGTNACIVWSFEEADENTIVTVLTEVGPMSMWAQSRSRFIKPGDDNFGFALWASTNHQELLKLGEGHHFGEWWGLGIQRGYGLEEKKFSLFNTRRWGSHNPNTPACCSVVPLIGAKTVEEAKEVLISKGSFAAPGYKNIEGLVMYEPDTDTCFKIIINK
jgi:hypothetical protein